MNIEQLYPFFQQSTGITTDSRQIAPGNLFLALSGDNFNGNDYAQEALDKGCSYAIVDDRKYVSNKQCLYVENCLETLQALASYHRQVMDIPVLAITGTNGKTTTKELISCVLKQRYSIIHTLGNLNNHIGVPLTLLRITKSTEMAIIEMGANHPGEISLLCNIAKPDYGIITNIGKAHLEGFGGFEGVIKTKNELYQFLSASNGTIFYNNNNDILISLLSDVRKNKIAYGSLPSAFCTGEAHSADPYLIFSIQKEGKIQTNLAGLYNFENALAAVCVGMFFKIPFKTIKNALENYYPENQRSQLKKTNANSLLMDFYNANPSSMSAALENFEKMTFKNKAVILGDMLELGEESDPEHLKIMNKLTQMKLDKVILVGEQFCLLNNSNSFVCFKHSDQLKNWLTDHPMKDFLILIKGSRGIKLERIIESL